MENKVSKFIKANDSFDGSLSEKEKQAATKKIEQGVNLILSGLGLDENNLDHNTKGTAERVARAYVNEIFSGMFDPVPKITEFENVSNWDQLIVTGPITINSTCAHHMLPFSGYCFIGVLPDSDSKLLGLSKYGRIVNHFARRLQIQEELTEQIAAFLNSEPFNPKGLAVRIVTQHTCATIRGLKDPCMGMFTQRLYGSLMDQSLKLEFESACNALLANNKFSCY